MTTGAVVSKASTRALALSAYRRLFRARRKPFGGDDKAMRESHFALRAQFELNKKEKDPKEIAIMLKMADEAEHVLLNEVLQGQLNKDGNYAVKLGPQHASSKGQFEAVSMETHVGDMEEDVKVETTTRKSE